MPELSTEQRDRLRDNDFAYIDPEGGRHLPIHDPEHVRAAIARFGQTEFARPARNTRPRDGSWQRPSAMTSRSTTSRR